MGTLKTKKTPMKKKPVKRSRELAPIPDEAPVFVLVGPFAKAAELSKWAHAHFRMHQAVCFIGVDSGLEPLYYSGLPVTIAIGDWDSLKKKELLKEVPNLGLKKDKDRSDLAVALDFARSLQASEIIAVGFQGGRFDHEWAASQEFSNAAAHVGKVTSLGVRGAFTYLSQPSARFEARLSAGQILSILPIGGVAHGVFVRGLRFIPQGGILSLSSEGLSNVVTDPKVRVSVRKGRVVVIVPA